MAGLKDYSPTAASNLTVGGISIAEGMLPSNINNAFRAMTADMRNWYNDSQWIIYGDGDGAHTAAYVSATSFTIAGFDVTSQYHADRRVRAVGSSTGTIYGYIVSSSFAASNTTVNMNWDSGSLSSESIEVSLGMMTKTGHSIPRKSISGSELSTDFVKSEASHAAFTPTDEAVWSSAAADARYFRQDSTETITSGVTWASNDTHAATTGAIDARIIDLVDDVGGFVPIASETAFPTTNPDVNDGAGTLVSIKSIGVARTPSGGTVTIASGSGSNTVLITGCGSTVLAAGFGCIIETTTTLHTYTFHRLTPKATEVTTVAGISTNVTNVGNAITNVNLVAGQISPTNNLATVAGITGIAALASAEVSGHVTTASQNVAGITSFAEKYRVASSAPTTSKDNGDLYYDTTANTLNVYNGSIWESISGGIGSLAADTSPELGGDLGLGGNSIDFPTTPNISDVLDEDNMASNSATKLATQQSIKAYADSLSHLSLIDEDNFATDSATRPPSQQSTKAYVSTQLGTAATAGFAIAMAVAL
jgi:hypothetical protein